MKITSIRSKVIAAMLACLAIGMLGMLTLMHYSFNHSANELAEQSLAETRNLFAVSEANEISKMSSISELLNANPQFGEALLAKDNFKLIGLTAQLYLKIKNDGVTNWTFHTPKPNMAPFLRLHNPAKSGDALNRFIDEEVSTKMSLVTGNQLDCDGLALRTIAPLFAAHGEIAGYVEFGEELGAFLRKMREQTGDNYGLLLNKKLADHKSWSESAALLGRPDNWDSSPNTVFIDKTSDSNQIVKFDGDLSALPSQGKVLERFHEGGSVFVRGVFPVQDASGKTIGAVFVVHDISAFYFGMRRTEMILAALAVCAGVIATVLFLFLLNRLIFRRLDRIILTATRVVGGDFETEIRISSEDEVGQFENLFEQFRRVFVAALAHVPELQQR